ncbi:MAG: hypothetical protein EXS47_01695 [Candidatus Zambryskibacteria bacterium]|nr:hypothetical protein [Candidatus Zambryskibacteria bacterium]
MIQAAFATLRGSLQDILGGFVTFIPKFLIAIIIFLIGWLVASLVRKVVAQVIRGMKVDHALRNLQVEQFVKRAGFNLDAGAFIGGLVEWLVIIVFLVASFEVIGLSQVNNFIQQVVLFYLPQVIIAALMILVAAVVAEAMQKIVSGTAAAGGIKSANFAGALARWSIWIFGILFALSQLGIGAQIINMLVQGMVVAIAIAIGLSFGLGGQDAAARLIEKARQEIAERQHHQ